MKTNKSDQHVLILASTEEGEKEIWNCCTKNIPNTQFVSVCLKDDPQNPFNYEDLFKPNLAGVVLVIEPNWLEIDEYRLSVEFLVDLVTKRDDFRVFIYFRNFTYEELENMQQPDDKDNCLASKILNTIQVTGMSTHIQLIQSVDLFCSNRGLRQATSAWLKRKNIFSTIIRCIYLPLVFCSFIVMIFGDIISLYSNYRLPRWMFSASIGICFSGLIPYILFWLSHDRKEYSKLPEVAKRSIKLYSVVFVVILLNLYPYSNISFHWLSWGGIIGLFMNGASREGGRSSLLKRTIESPHHQAENITSLGYSESPLSYCPLLPLTPTAIFISYARKPGTWSRSFADKAHRAIKNSNVMHFLDRVSIPEGSCWHKYLREAISNSSAVVAAIDAYSCKRRMTAYELELALYMLYRVGSPRVFLLAPYEGNLLDELDKTLSTEETELVYKTAFRNSFSGGPTDPALFPLPDKYGNDFFGAIKYLRGLPQAPLSIISHKYAPFLEATFRWIFYIGAPLTLSIAAVLAVAFFTNQDFIPKESLKLPLGLILSFFVGLKLRFILASPEEVPQTLSIRMSMLTICLFFCMLTIYFLPSFSKSWIAWTYIFPLCGWYVSKTVIKQELVDIKAKFSSRNYGLYN